MQSQMLREKPNQLCSCSIGSSRNSMAINKSFSSLKPVNEIGINRIIYIIVVNYSVSLKLSVLVSWWSSIYFSLVQTFLIVQ